MVNGSSSWGMAYFGVLGLGLLASGLGFRVYDTGGPVCHGALLIVVRVILMMFSLL